MRFRKGEQGTVILWDVAKSEWVPRQSVDAIDAVESGRFLAEEPASESQTQAAPEKPAKPKSANSKPFVS